jgi:phenylalanyl-tRNA synthetase beta chain
MLIPFDWLTEFVDVNEPVDQLAERLTMAGLEVEAIRCSDQGTALDLKITPNRGDCLSVIGVAREVAALTGSAVRPPPSDVVASGPPQPRLSVEIRDPDLCPRYVARLVRDVGHGESPDWMQRRLILAGLRPINAVVDATNYVMLETGQPLHAFDYDLLEEGRIVVRRARPGESIVTIDQTEVSLGVDMLVIADARRPVAIAGVMGGADTEVTVATRRVLIESAHFDPASIRRTARAIPLATAASYRFERVVDPQGVRAAADRAALLIVEIAGGTISETVVDEFPRPKDARRIRFRPERVRALLGADISDAEMERSLARLAVRVAREDPEVWTARPPSWRPDLALEEDLAEEVARLHGYEAIPATLPAGIAAPGKISALEQVTSVIRDQLQAQGCYEAATNTLLSRVWLEATGFQESPAWPLAPARLLTLRNPLSEEFDTMRPSLVPGLLAALQRNLRLQAEDVFLFEVGWAHVQLERAAAPDDRLLAAAVLYGSRWAGGWNADPAWRADFCAARGAVEALARALYLGPLVTRVDAGPAFHPGRSAVFLARDRVIAAAGELDPAAAARLDLPRGVYVLECDAQTLVELVGSAGRYEPPSRFPAALRDMAIVVPDTVAAAQVEEVLRGELADWLRDLRVFDVYRGRPLPEGCVSLAFSLRLGAPDRTLTDAEVDERMARLRDRLRQSLGAEIREG